MERVYLLLRQNTESGPFTLPELKQLQLQPTDLVWVEGTSTAWSSATCITEPTDDSFRGPETDSWESPRTEPGRRSTEAAGAAAAFVLESSRAQRSRVSPSHSDDEDIELILHKRDGATVSLVQLLGAAVVTALLALAWDHRFELLQTQDDSITYASAPVVFTPRIPTPEPMQSLATGVSADSGVAPLPNPIREKEPVKNSRNRKTPRQPQTAIATTSENNTSGSGMEQPANTEAPLVAPAIEEPVSADTPSVAAEKEAGESEQVKKKTLGQAIKNLFRKKDKREKKDEEKGNQ